MKYCGGEVGWSEQVELKYAWTAIRNEILLEVERLKARVVAEKVAKAERLKLYRGLSKEFSDYGYKV